MDGRSRWTEGAQRSLSSRSPVSCGGVREFRGGAWDVAPSLEHKFRTMYQACGLGSMIDNLKACTGKLLRLFVLNRCDVIVIEGDSCLAGPQAKPDTLWTASEWEGRARWQFVHPKGSGVEGEQPGPFVWYHASGDVTGLLNNLAEDPADFITTLAYPRAPLQNLHRNEFKKVNKCALAKKYEVSEKPKAGEPCIVRGQITRSAVPGMASPRRPQHSDKRVPKRD